MAVLRVRSSGAWRRPLAVSRWTGSTWEVCWANIPGDPPSIVFGPLMVRTGGSWETVLVT